jgi:hypothetical protein
MATRKTKPVSAETAPEKLPAAASKPAPRKAVKKAAPKAAKKAVKNTVKKTAAPRKKAAAAPMPERIQVLEPIPGAEPGDKFPLSSELMDELTDNDVEAVEARPEQVPAFPPVPSPGELREEITRQAFQFWVDRSYRPGDPKADWLRAEDQVLRRYGLR